MLLLKLGVVLVGIIIIIIILVDVIIITCNSLQQSLIGQPNTHAPSHTANI